MGFNKRIDLEYILTLAAGTPLFEFVDITHAVGQGTDQKKYILDLVLTTQDDNLRDVNVDEELGSSAHKIFRFTLKIQTYL